MGLGLRFGEDEGLRFRPSATSASKVVVADFKFCAA